MEESSNYEPSVGMEFNTVEEVKVFYSNYASSNGFGWKIRTSRKGPDGELNYFILVCSREGNYESKIPSSVKTLPTKRARCEAKVTATKGENNLWYIKKVVLDHCHELNPTKGRLFNKNRRLNMHVKRNIDVNDGEEVRINKMFQSLVQDVGGYENLSFVEREVRNYINKERRAIGKEGDAKALVNYFSRMKEQNRNFWCDIDLDEEFHVKNVFWADDRSRAAYEAFGDVVSFDTTCLTNKYDMPFVAFVGVNHHGQSILLGCGLLSSEDTKSFMWLFNSWVRCMFGKPPSGIVTDQCWAMQKAIEIVLPNTRHRWCLWNLLRKISEKLKGYGAYKGIMCAIKEAVYESHTREEFEGKWGSLLKEFDIEENEWFNGLFNERHKWVPIFLKHDFWAGLSTSQKSESVHTCFDGYVNSTTNLQQFVQHYDNALRSMVEKEFVADFNSMNTIIHCGSHSPIEKQFQGEYTHAKFGEVQIEFRGKMNCVPSLKCIDGSVATYHVLEEILVGNQPKETFYEVVFDHDNHDVSCQCLLFEFRGIMCRHSLCVLAIERVKEVSSKYILSRWSKNIKWKHSYIKSSYDVSESKLVTERFDKLCKHFFDVAKLAAESDEATNLLHCALDKFISDSHGMPSLHTNNSTSNAKDIIPNLGIH